MSSRRGRPRDDLATIHAARAASRVAASVRVAARVAAIFTDAGVGQWRQGGLVFSDAIQAVHQKGQQVGLVQQREIFVVEQ